MRIDPDILRRVDALANKQRTSPRAIWEQLADVALPALERQYGIPGDEEPPNKPRGGSS